LRSNRVIPLGANIGVLDAEGLYLRVAGLKAGAVLLVHEGRVDLQALRGGRGPDVPEGLVVASQRLTGPVHADVTEEAVLDRVVFRGASRVVADNSRESVRVSHLSLQLDLPEAAAVPVRTATVAQD